MIPDKTNLRKWVAGLRSGDYRQDSGQLKIVAPDGRASYCCLGVACELAVRDGVDIAETVKNGLILFGLYQGLLDSPVMEWLGVSHDNPVIGIDDRGREISAIKANDAFHWSFNKIADAIEEFYELKEEHDDPQQDQPA